MIELKKNEKVLLVLHRHWIVIAGQVVATVLLFLIPIILVLFGGLFQKLPGGGVGPFLFFIITLYWMVVVGWLFVVWIKYWLDVWVITTERVIDIDQVALFHRRISEFSLTRVQDVTVSIPNILATFLGFGNITVQTAGETSFSIRDVSHCNQAKSIILSQSEKLRKDS
ncbi:MAG: hypothetical protein A3C80_04155 [Candidatus Ryanbacteria bacterium RIFCSPHIGHO2_02_FULL_45_43]|uniref:YdbS-like PH domain-containing protein n=1 Tax=Candidatus Ryanbacteria bacterium RIFCSPHIGHO2_01_45_13 TaxID=1802112 RepID=A0A1G2FXM1_9BACT|nr:MAG: hypothetical protein A2718_00185 [Candidatus Ryanbacteria bacterium RIFCSPHIGHO2_01_FULL_44_130]OGZ42825.1 MAG: hypothetical protein A2W41_00725 [Candidatus Ryanbacteria bacterium RIFCSPHIGHO2_01_45_13]OGZ48229.1 MAG: hypothetical protein A3C80_04155 [Candidatus Ryanbacteria bacterium RIFCSPHIGHO2_02_FULL_45_43]OGZ50005.1 MAG: hypothetical protein A3E55_01815 [Candidatus Ryanbacteria bacterium RIFCSPHIGHO2_12_FULL_44_20]OGZ51464.1 MAG: hypothetical protein A3A17_01765 [Candidatus Ryanba